MYKDRKLMKHGDGYIVFSNDEQVIKLPLNINDDLMKNPSYFNYVINE